MSKTGKSKIKNQKSKMWNCQLPAMNSLILHFAFCILILSAGCEQFFGGADVHQIKIAPEKLRRIETLDLEQIKGAEAKPVPSADSGQALSEAEGPPPEQLELSLEQCRAWALESNLDLKVQLISPSIAAERVTEEEAKFEAAFFSNVSFNKSDTPVVSYLDIISGSKIDYFRTDLGVQVPLQSGGTVTFDLANSRVKTDSQLTTFNPYYDSDLSLSISQPLLRNAGRWVNTYSIRIAEYQRQITDATTKLEVIRVIAALDRVYWRLYAARRELQVRQRQYELAEALLEQARRFVESGQRPPVEIIRAEAGAAQQLEAIIVAQNNPAITMAGSFNRCRYGNARESFLAQSDAFGGLGVAVLVPLTEADPKHFRFTIFNCQLAIANRQSPICELELQIAQDTGTLDYMRSQALPLVTLDYRYNINGLGATEDDSFDLLFNKKFEDHRLGLQLVVPLGNSAAESRLRQAFYQRVQRLASRDSRRAIIELEVLNAIDQVEANWQRILASRQRAILDGRLFEAERRQFEIGLRTSTDVLQSQISFADAQSAEIRALAEYQIALVDLAYATGMLLGAAKVQWQPVVPAVSGK